MAKKNYTTHRAIFSVQFDCKDCDPDETADEIVRDIISAGIPAVLDEVEDVEDGSADDLRPMFICKALEAGHGEDFMATFVILKKDEDIYSVESVDLMMQHPANENEWIPIGGVGGEIPFIKVCKEDGSLDIERMCRGWIGAWHREFFGQAEDSVRGLFLMLKQTISEGKFTK